MKTLSVGQNVALRSQLCQGGCVTRPEMNVALVSAALRNPVCSFRCQMDLRKFPLDSQTCPLKIGSFGHGAGDIVYKVS